MTQDRDRKPQELKIPDSESVNELLRRQNITGRSRSKVGVKIWGYQG